MLYPQILSAHTKDLGHVTPPCILFPTVIDTLYQHDHGEVKNSFEAHREIGECSTFRILMDRRSAKYNML